MNIDIWITFVITVSIFAVIPGPTVIFVVAKSLTNEKKVIFPLLLGTLLANIITIVLSFLGVGALLEASATLFNLLKYLGALYLIFSYSPISKL